MASVRTPGVFSLWSCGSRGMDVVVGVSLVWVSLSLELCLQANSLARDSESIPS